MNYMVELSAQARVDLESIYEYIAYTLLSPSAAEGQLDRLEQNILELDHMPMRFQEYDEEPWHSRGLRMMPVDNYLVLYIPNEVTSKVTVIRVMYVGRDIRGIMREYRDLPV